MGVDVRNGVGNGGGVLRGGVEGRDGWVWGWVYMKVRDVYLFVGKRDGELKLRGKMKRGGGGNRAEGK